MRKPTPPPVHIDVEPDSPRLLVEELENVDYTKFRLVKNREGVMRLETPS